MAEAPATESIFATTIFVFLSAATLRLLAFSKILYSVLLLVGAMVRSTIDFETFVLVRAVAPVAALSLRR